VKANFQVQLALKFMFLSLILTGAALAQAPEGPQADAPPSATPVKPPTPRPTSTGAIVTVPAGTRIGVVLENGISTATAKAGDSIYFRTSFPVTIDNKVVIPVGSYLRGEITESKRAGHVKGRAELRLHLSTLVFPNGYTVDLNADPHSTDSGKVKTDPEGKMTGPGGKGKDAATIGETTATGAGIGAGIGGLAGLAAVLFTRGPEANLPRGSSMDLQLERELQLDADQIHYTNVGQPNTVIIQPAPQN